MQHVIDPFEAARLFHGHETMRLFDDADHGMIAARRRTKSARIELGEIVTDRTEDDLLFHFAQRCYQSLQIGIGNAHDVKRQALR